ncbi:syntaxin-7-like isoform X2 [Lytechinus variegatus]|uniref:syntaxin-7-like isoform X2 n=1 Tax=Lytechinus variegatus TaxID=7654 RepID=UPI001BB15D37|nr:syntaxin-7-like isoform X2 [Lytechinus variegatus]
MSFGKGDFGDGGSNNSFSTYHGSAGKGSGSTSDFNRLSQGIAGNVHKITQNVREIEGYIARLGTHEDNKGLRGKLDEVQHYTNQLAKDTNKMLKDLNSIPPSYSDQKQQKMQRERLTGEFTSALNQFQRVQRDAAQRERDSYDKVRTGSTTSGGYEDHSSDTLIGGFESSRQDTGMTQQSQVSYEDFEAIKERESQLKKLESDILDVNQIFKDLATMVHEQGDMIDSIEANVESAEVHVEQANTQLEKAVTYQSKARRKKFLLLICVLVLIVVVALIIYFSVRN